MHRLKLPNALSYVNSKINCVLTFWENIMTKDPLPEGIKAESILTMFYGGSEVQSFITSFNQKYIDAFYLPPNLIISENDTKEITKFPKVRNLIKIPAADFAKLISYYNQFHTEYKQICSSS